VDGGAEWDAVPVYPQKSRCILSSGSIEKVEIDYQAIFMTARSRIVLYAKGNHVCGRVAAYVELRRGRVALSCSTEPFLLAVEERVPEFAHDRQPP
jgi:hypothetical protein